MVKQCYRFLPLYHGKNCPPYVGYSIHKVTEAYYYSTTLNCITERCWQGSAKEAGARGRTQTNAGFAKPLPTPLSYTFYSGAKLADFGLQFPANRASPVSEGTIFNRDLGALHWQEQERNFSAGCNAPT